MLTKEQIKARIDAREASGLSTLDGVGQFLLYLVSKMTFSGKFNGEYSYVGWHEYIVMCL